MGDPNGSLFDLPRVCAWIRPRKVEPVEDQDVYFSSMLTSNVGDGMSMPASLKASAMAPAIAL